MSNPMTLVEASIIAEDLRVEVERARCRLELLEKELEIARNNVANAAAYAVEEERKRMDSTRLRVNFSLVAPINGANSRECVVRASCSRFVVMALPGNGEEFVTAKEVFLRGAARWPQSAEVSEFMRTLGGEPVSTG